MNPPRFQFEVCANGVESCLAAQAGGADRVELCAGIPEGGTTPSFGDIATARSLLDRTRLHVIIRPRGGDFRYSPLEERIMLEDIANARRLGADGVVLGCLTIDGTVDLPLMGRLMKAAQGMSVTFHRAFDVCRDATLCLEGACELGLATILTSGQAADAWAGRALLARLQQQAAGRIEILAGAGVSARNIPDLVRQTHVTACHLSGKKRVPSRMVFRRAGVPMGLPGFDEFELWQTDPAAIRAARAALDGVHD